MPAKRLLSVLVAISLCACSSIDGLYAPACIAYEGSEIELSGNRFTWRRFTDERKLDEHGEPVDAFPGFPKTGQYRFHNSQVDLIPDDGQSSVSFYLYDDAQGKYMLSNAENKQYQSDGGMPECALRRVE